MSHDTNRFTPDDMAAIAARMSEVEATARRTATPIDRDDLTRAGIRAIGCTGNDLRPSEVRWSRACADMVQAATKVNGVAKPRRVA